MKEQIIKILSEIRPEFDFTNDVNFIEEGMLDSFDIVSLVSAIDEEFKISVLGKDIVPGNFSSLDNIVALINRIKTK
jgi:acyl carrier protein